MSVKLGDTVGAYSIVGELGAGGSGQVFRARHTITGRVEALKMLSDSGAPGSARAERFLKEIRLQAKLDHPNIAVVYNAFWLDETLVMVMEFVEGTSLRELLASGPLAVGSVLDYGRQALDALAYTHDNGVTHRDISPSNILITPKGDVKLTDFGLAAIAADPADLKDSRLMGSAYYMSPEQVKSSPDLDHRTDIYSLGVVLYEALTGTRPFEADDVFSIMEAHVDRQPDAPSRRNPRLSAAMDAVVLKALAKDREQRFSSVREFAGALDGLDSRKAESSVPLVSRAVEVQESPTEPVAPETNSDLPSPAAVAVAPSRPELKRWVLQGLAGFAAVIVVALLLLPWLSPDSSESVADSAQAPAWEPAVVIDPERVSPKLLEGGGGTELVAEAATSDAAAAAAESRPSVGPVNSLLPSTSSRLSPLTASAAPRLPAPPIVDPSIDDEARSTPSRITDSPIAPFSLLKPLDAGAPVNAVALSNDGRAVAGATDDGRIGVWDTAGDKIATLQGHEGQVTALAFSPDGKRLASAGSDGTAKVWDILRQREARTLGHKGPVTSVSFSPNGSQLATGSDDKVVSVWDLTGQGAFREYRGHKRPAQAVAFSPDGKRLASTSREVRLWSAAADTRAEKLDGLPEDAVAAAFSPDGATLAVAAVNVVGLWNLKQGRRQQAVRVPGAKYALTFTASGRCLAVSASGGPSGEVKLWDLANPDPLVSLSAGGVLRAVAMTDSAGFIAAAGDDGRISVWRKDPAYLGDAGITKP